MNEQLELFPVWEWMRKHRTIACHDGSITGWKVKEVIGEGNDFRYPMTAADYRRWENEPYAHLGLLRFRP
jgi:hypothetical protein